MLLDSVPVFALMLDVATIRMVMAVSDFEMVWRRIVALGGQEFRQKTGRLFAYRVDGNAVTPSTTVRVLPRSQFERAYARRPLNGPGQLRDLQGPSYLHAILADPRVQYADEGEPSEGEVDSVARVVPGSPASATARSGDLPMGHAIEAERLQFLGFQQLDLHLDDTVQLAEGQGTNWTTVGDVPCTAGLYAFTLARRDELRVVYVGMTTHLWMVTRGVLPGSVPRPAQRYGRPRHAGVTRRRVNILATRAIAAHWTPHHWVTPHETSAVDLPAILRSEEEKLIVKWNLRGDGWNRG